MCNFLLGIKIENESLNLQNNWDITKLLPLPNTMLAHNEKKKTGRILHAQYPTALIRSRRREQIKLGIIMAWWNETIIGFGVRETCMFNKFTSLQLLLIILSFTKSLLQNCDIHCFILSMKLSTGSIQNTPYRFLIEWICLI